MNYIALAKEDEVLKYLCNGLPEGRPNTAAARCEEQKGLEVFRKTMKTQSVACMQENEFRKIYQNSFPGVRTRFQEYSRISLASVERK